MPFPLLIGATFWGTVTAFFAGLLPVVIWQVVAILGLGVTTFVGFDLIMSSLLDDVFSDMSALPVNVLTMLVIGKIDIALNMIVSSFVTAFSIKIARDGLSFRMFPKLN